MDHSLKSTATILLATDSIVDAEMVKNLLSREFDHVFLSTDPDMAVSDFDQQRPDVLVLAFNELEKSERYYLGLYRFSQVLQQHPHRTVILCSKEEVTRVYEMCMKDFFDDYVLFWPMTFDASRLLMSVHYALRELAALKANAPSISEFATQSRLLGGLEGKLDQQVEQGIRHIEATSLAMEQAEQGISSALDKFSEKLIAEAQPDPAAIKNPDAVKNEISRFKQQEVHQHFHAAAESAKPLKEWAQGLKQECEPQMESARVLKSMAERVRPVVLVVDDDEFQHKIIGKILETENYRLIFAFNGVQAMGVLRKTKPDVILMDISMPDMGGIELTSRLRRIPQFAKTPVIMVTGNSDNKTVISCIKAGANNFVVKPIDSSILTAKIVQVLNAIPPEK
jgi:PleD family two-component response regulator